MSIEAQVWFGVLLLLSPVVVFAVAWVRSHSFYTHNTVRQRQKTLYVVALALASVSTLPYLGFWCWWTAKLYRVTVPFRLELTLERFILASLLFCAASIVCLLIGP